MDTVNFYYFSGTGNTFLVVKKMQETFKKHNIIVHLHKIENSDPKSIDLNSTIGLGFPVAVLSTYPFIWNFIESLPPASGTDIFMVDTLGGFSGGIVGPLKEIVKKKGYNPIGAFEIQMPPNIFYIQNNKINEAKVSKGLLKAEKYALNLIDGRSKWERFPILSDGVNIFSKGALKLTSIDLHQKFFLFNPDTNKCNKCGICAKICPIQNIEMKEGDYPIHGLKCEYCLRCVSFCPRNAIPSKFNYKGKTYRACKVKDIL